MQKRWIATPKIITIRDTMGEQRKSIFVTLERIR